LINDVTSFILVEVDKRRARTELDKVQRAADILDAARQSFDEHRFDTFTMDDVAARLGLAKGTLYRYHPTRESLLLAVLGDELIEWFAQVDRLLDDGEGVVESIVTPLLSRPGVMRLLAVLPTVLEHNVPPDTAVEFKRFVLEQVTRTGATIDDALGGIAGQGAQLLLQLNAVVVGLYHMAYPSPVVTQVLARPEFAALRVDLGRELTTIAHALVKAITHIPEGVRS
jgi:AcrR family transcriptional regulator